MRRGEERAYRVEEDEAHRRRWTPSKRKQNLVSLMRSTFFSVGHLWYEPLFRILAFNDHNGLIIASVFFAGEFVYVFYNAL